MLFYKKTLLLQILKYNAKVKAENGHSWTEIIIPFYSLNYKKIYFKIKIDNTFDKISFHSISKKNINKWESDLGKSKTQIWYNDKAFSKTEQDKISTFVIDSKISAKLENTLVAYINKK